MRVQLVEIWELLNDKYQQGVHEEKKRRRNVKHTMNDEKHNE